MSRTTPGVPECRSTRPRASLSPQPCALNGYATRPTTSDVSADERSATLARIDSLDNTAWSQVCERVPRRSLSLRIRARSRVCRASAGAHAGTARCPSVQLGRTRAREEGRCTCPTRRNRRSGRCDECPTCPTKCPTTCPTRSAPGMSGGEVRLCLACVDEMDLSPCDEPDVFGMAVLVLRHRYDEVYDAPPRAFPESAWGRADVPPNARAREGDRSDVPLDETAGQDVAPIVPLSPDVPRIVPPDVPLIVPLEPVKLRRPCRQTRIRQVHRVTHTATTTPTDTPVPPTRRTSSAADSLHSALAPTA